MRDIFSPWSGGTRFVLTSYFPFQSIIYTESFLLPFPNVYGHGTSLLTVEVYVALNSDCMQEETFCCF